MATRRRRYSKTDVVAQPPYTKHIDGKMFKRIDAFTVKRDAERKAKEIRKKGSHGYVTNVRIIRGPEKEPYIRKSSGIRTRVYFWYIYVHETHRKMR